MNARKPDMTPREKAANDLAELRREKAMIEKRIRAIDKALACVPPYRPMRAQAGQ